MISGPMRGLTPKQKIVLRHVQEGWRLKDKSPTYRELARELRLDVKTVLQHVVALERKECVTRNGRAGIRLTPQTAQPRGIPLLHVRVGAGPPGAADSVAHEHLDLVRNLGLDLATTFLLPVRGISMVGRGIQDGDVVVIRRDLPVGNGDVAAVVIGEDAIVKTVRKESGQVRFFSEPKRGGLRKVPVPSAAVPRLFGPVVAAFRLVKQSFTVRQVQHTYEDM